jgi:protein involved in polysaccharide export with SLBB domain
MLTRNSRENLRRIILLAAVQIRRRSTRKLAFRAGTIFPVLILVSLLVGLAPSGLRAYNGGQDIARPSAKGTEYHLGALDKLRVRVSAWRPARAEVFSWKALDGVYAISGSGTISLPLLGEVEAAGATTVELASAIADRLKDRIGLAESPDVSIEVVQFRPFYIVGRVDHPGEYPYRPGLNVLQALAIAGGNVRIGEQRLEREVITTTGEISQLEAEKIVVLTRKARLDAEMRGLEEAQFALPADVRNASFAKLAIAQEKQIFDARQTAYKTQYQALQQLHGYLEKEVASLEGQIENHDKEMDLLRTEYETVKSLVSKGLTTEPRRLGLERNLAQAQGDKLRLESALMRAKQDISKTEIDILQLRNKRSDEVAAELAVAGNKLEEIGRRLQTAQQLINESETIAPTLQTGKSQLKYTIVRVNGDAVSEVAANEKSPIEPGDTLKVELTLPKASPEVAVSHDAAPALRLQETSRLSQEGRPVDF